MIFDNRKYPLQSFYYCQKYMEDCFFNCKKINWVKISTNYELPEWFITLHLDELEWKLLTQYQNWKEDQIRLFKNYIIWEFLNPRNYSANFLREFRDKLDFHIFKNK